MKKVFVHCGFHKTATKYLQTLLQDNEATLKPQLHVLNRSKDHTREARLACLAFSKGDASVSADDVLQRFHRLADEIEKHPQMPSLITDAAFMGLHIGQEGEKRIYPRAHELAALICKGLGQFDVKLVLYTRNPARWLRNSYNQAVKQHRYGGSYDDFMSEVEGPPDWDALRARMSAYTDARRLTYFRLEDDGKRSFGVGAQLFELIGLDDAVMGAIAPVYPQNEALRPWMLAMMRKLNKSSLSDGQLHMIRRAVINARAQM